MKSLFSLILILFLSGCFESTPADRYLVAICIDGHYDILDWECEIKVSESEFGNRIIWSKGEYGWHGKDLVANYEWYAKSHCDRKIVEEYLAWKKRN